MRPSPRSPRIGESADPAIRVAAGGAVGMSDWRSAIDEFLDEGAESLRSIRRHLHAHPEPSREEFQTAAFVASHLERAGVPFRLAAGGRGLIADSPSRAGTPRIAFRADLDALLLRDGKDVPYRSTRDGVAHACGHDAHTTIALGAALALGRCREQLPGPVAWRAIFQPAEELGEGAAEMVAEGAMRDVAAILALHVDPDREVGRVGLRDGVLTAFCEEVHVVVRGRGGHAARPHQAIDPIAAAARFLTLAYEVVPRSIDSREPVVVSFAAIAGGHSPNVIPDRVLLRGTLRSLDAAVASRARERLGDLARGLSEVTRASIEVEFRHPIAGVVNDPGVTGAYRRAAAEVVGADRVEEIPLPSLGGEDFAGYLDHAPGCLMRLGVASPDAPRHPLHSPHFDIDERALVLGAKVLARAVVLAAGGGGRP